jgi:alkylation response protein AidB-like acyl-CoA dehydrogenase
MSIFLSEEQTTFRDGVRAFLERRSSSAAVRALLDSPEGYDRAVWKQMADQLGLQGLHVPEEHDGSGFTAVELCLVSREVGRVLLPAPWLSTVVLAATALVESGDEDAMARYLPGIAAGETIATVALPEASRAGASEVALVHARPSAASSARLYGVVDLVLDGCAADVLLLAAGDDAGGSLYAVDLGAPGVTREPIRALDPSRRLARITLDGVEAARIGDAGAAAALIARTRDLAAVALAAEAVGGAEAMLAMSVAYAKDRFQFGRPIGSFQAIKHRCADLLVEVDSASLLADWAARAAAEQPEALPVAAAECKARCTDAFVHAAAAAIQIHGGIGFTWEHDAHLYFKRAKFDQLLLGHPDLHRERAAQALITRAAA